MGDLVLVGLSHRTAPLPVREAVAFRRDDLKKGLESLRADFAAGEGVILSTCNRVEIYALGLPEGREKAAVALFLAGFHGVSEDLFRRSLYERRGREALLHLFRVTSGIDSMVVGEHQVQGQVKEAFAAAVEAAATGPYLNAVFQRALHVGKRVRTETEVGRGEVSVATVVRSLAERIFDRFSDKTVLLIGAGEISSLAIRQLSQRGIGGILVCNRTAGRAEELALSTGGKAVPYEDLASALSEADIVISSTQAPHFVIQPEAVRRALRFRRGRPVFLVDLAVPRDINPEVNEIDNVYLYDLDDLQRIAGESMKDRAEQAGRAEPLLEEEAERFAREIRVLDVGRIIADLREKAGRIARKELETALGPLDQAPEEERRKAQRALDRTVNQLLHRPIQALREAAASGDGLEISRIVRELFDLNLGPAGRDPTGEGPPP